MQTLLRVSVHPLCAIACINICAHVQDPVVHVRVQWMMETLKHPACTVDWVHNSVTAGFPWEMQPEFPMGEITMGQYSCKKNYNKKTSTKHKKLILDSQ